MKQHMFFGYKIAVLIVLFFIFPIFRDHGCCEVIKTSGKSFTLKIKQHRSKCEIRCFTKGK